MKKWLIKVVAILYIQIGCGVEAGNPDPSVPETQTGSSTQVALTTYETEESQSFVLGIESLEVVNSDSKETYNIQLEEAEPELYQEGESVLVSNQQALPVGEYDTLIMHFRADRPAVRRQGGIRQESRWKDGDFQGIRLPIQLEITSKAEVQTLLITINPDTSLEQEGDSFVFKPQASGGLRRQLLDYSATTDIAGAISVCAYLVAGTSSQPAPRTVMDESELDTDGRCRQAFRRSRVRSDGAYKLRHLVPGTYLVRVFTAPRQYVDLERLVLDSSE